MVHVKRLELSNFKSFGGTTQIPLLPGFTVVSGPNGSGKSNILDALLFALGLASSRGMRAERLPDLVNHNQASRGRGTVEASVTVTFDLGDAEETTAQVQEWSVTRRLRVTHQGSYTSTYYINGVACNLTELHEQLNQVRIYPEGYNVVLQGDVTSIISMNPRERREIIDELAGVATFDRKIAQAKETLNEVKEREDRSRIVEKELISQRDRLSQDRIKAEKYQKLRLELQQKTQWEAVLVWRSLQQQQEQLVAALQSDERTQAELTAQLLNAAAQIQQETDLLDRLNRRVKALGEEDQLALQSTIASLQAELRQLQRQERELNGAAYTSQLNIEQTELEIQQHQETLTQLAQQQALEHNLVYLSQQKDAAKQNLDKARSDATEIAAASSAWVEQQTALNRQIETLLQTLEPQRTEKALLEERNSQSARQIEEQSQLIQTIEPEIATKQTQVAALETQLLASSTQVESFTQALAAAEQELTLQQETQKRLLLEQREKQRQLDKLEAQTQAVQETQGTYATKVILQSGMSGICGLVAQLGKVELRYQLALETAAGGRLGMMVVEDDAVAAAAIELLKQKRAGRATFLPLNKITAPRFSPTVALRYANGFIDYAINLIECDRRYQDVFAFVFGNTVVFETLSAARPFLGQNRLVTLDGELLETSGAITGGSTTQRSGLHFGGGDATESDEAFGLRNRLQDIELVLKRCGEAINSLATKTKQLGTTLIEARQQKRESQFKCEQLQKEIKSLTLQVEMARSQLSQTTQQLTATQSRWQTLEQELPGKEASLLQLRQALVELEQSHQNREWQEIQLIIRSYEQQVQEQVQALSTAEQRLKDLENQQQRLSEKIQQLSGRVHEYRALNTAQHQQLLTLNEQLGATNQQIDETQKALSQLNEQLQEEKQLRDRAEVQLRDRHLTQQQLEWQQQKLQETQRARREELATLQAQLHAQRLELPDPLVEVPDKLNLEGLQREMRSLTGKLQALEPVNMLALEEYEHTQNRLEQLTERLMTLEAERTELLLRIENFTTLRQTAFKEAFDAVNQNFQTIFATLSEGDGYLQLDNPEVPFDSGLNLVAHPKGKPVQRLASMSGGEKSLTALSFIFALQRYRPSPFYAFDEVDMFLDGANVERLARMIEQEAKQAQFIVVSLRRPMIESAERTIGVTQARGAYTQVLGLKL